MPDFLKNFVVQFYLTKHHHHHQGGPQYFDQNFQGNFMNYNPQQQLSMNQQQYQYQQQQYLMLMQQQHLQNGQYNMNMNQNGLAFNSQHLQQHIQPYYMGEDQIQIPQGQAAEGQVYICIYIYIHT
jgi:hypothetical protein